MTTNTEYQNIELVGNKKEFAGYPVELFIKEGKYYIKCKEVYISYASFLIWEKVDSRRNKIGINKEGTPAKISKRDSYTRIACLRENDREFNKLKLNIKRTVQWDQKQKRLQNQQHLPASQ